MTNSTTVSSLKEFLGGIIGINKNVNSLAKVNGFNF